MRLTRQHVIAVALLICTGLTSLAITHRRLGTLLRGWDAQFYFAQAHSLVFRGSTDLTASIEESPWAEDFGPEGIQNLPRQDGRVVNKYPVGLSLIEAPLLMLGDLLSKMVRMPSDSLRSRGWNAVVVLTVAAGLFLITATGLTALYLRLESEFSAFPAAMGVCCCWLGTSLFFYSAVNPFMAHGAGFTLVVMLVLQIERHCLIKAPSLGAAIAMGIAAGLLFLVRPQQILLLPIMAVFIPWKIWTDRAIWSFAAMFSAAMLAVCLVQPAFHYFNFGRFTVNAYAAGGEGFSWFRPDWYTVLFSPHRGLLFFSPIVAFSSLRFFIRTPLSFCERVFLLHGITQAYLIMCWSSPDQGNAFGARMWCEATPLVAFCVARISGIVLGTQPFLGYRVWLPICSACSGWTTLLMLSFIRFRGISGILPHTDVVKAIFSTIQ